MADYPRRYEAVLAQFDRAWASAETGLRLLREIEPASIQDALHIGQAIAAAATAIEASKTAASTIGRTSTKTWKGS